MPLMTNTSIAVYLQRRMLAVLLLGFSSGLPLALVFSTLSVWLAESGVSRTAIGLFAAAGTPYTLKFLWSPLVDSMKIPLLSTLFGRRSGWMLFSQAMLIVFLVGLGYANPESDPWWTAILALSVAFFSATQDIVIDAYRVELLNEDEQGAGAAMAVFGYRIGMLVSGAGALFIAQYAGWMTAYVVMACLIVVGMVTVLLKGEPKRDIELTEKETEESFSYVLRLKKAVVEPFSDFMTHPGWWLILLFIVLYKMGDAFAGVMTNPFFVELGFSKVEIASVNKIFGFVASITGALLGGVFVKRYGTLKSLWVCGILQMLTNLMFVVMAKTGYQMETFVVTVSLENLAGGMGTAAFVAYMSSLCHIHYTATQYALLSSLSAVGRTWISASSGAIVDAIGWPWFFSLTVLAAVPGLVLLKLLSHRLSRY